MRRLLFALTLVSGCSTAAAQAEPPAAALAGSLSWYSEREYAGTCLIDGQRLRFVSNCTALDLERRVGQGEPRCQYLGGCVLGIEGK